MGFVKARASSFYYEEQGEGQPILLIPPSGSTASTWGTLPSDLAGAGRLIVYDDGADQIRPADRQAQRYGRPRARPDRHRRPSRQCVQDRCGIQGMFRGRPDSLTA